MYDYDIISPCPYAKLTTERQQDLTLISFNFGPSCPIEPFLGSIGSL